MSYVRYGSIFQWVDGESKDYIFYHVDNYMEDYGSIHNETMVELIAKNIEDNYLRDYIVPILAERLNVKLRDKPLTRGEQLALWEKRWKEQNKDVTKQ